MDGMTRSAVAERAKVHPETVRYYERRGLIPDPPRSGAGYRLYDESYVDRLQFIRRAQELGFTLEEIKGLLELRVDDEAACQDVKARAEAKIEDVEAKLQDLQRIRDALVTLAGACADGVSPTSACPILDALENEGALFDAFTESR
jgi:MerR family mercuric resistance operon transcriptional regulator